MNSAGIKAAALIDEIARRCAPEIVKWRRQIHSRPELGWCEYITTHHIVSVLSQAGWSVRYGKNAINLESRYGLPSPDELQMAERRAMDAGVPPDFLANLKAGATGVVAEMEMAQAGPMVAIRFEIDAVPIHESCDSDHLPHVLGFSSVYPGVMHACGHDGHVAIGLGLGTVLSRLAENLSGKVRLLFQPAEEGCRGAQSMADAGALSNVDYLVGLHLGVKATSTGTLFCGVNGLLATHKFDVNFTGRSAHAGIDPEEGRNALLAAAAAALNIHAASPHGEGSSRVNVGSLIAGDGRNVIPSGAHMKVETRGSESRIEEYVYQHALHCIQGAATSYQVDYDIIPMGWAPSAKCDRELVEVMREASNLVPEIFESADLLDSYGGSDDFSIMIDLAQKSGSRACFSCLGSNLAAGHHREKFDFDEESLVIGVKLLSHSINLLLNGDTIDRLGL